MRDPDTLAAQVEALEAQGITNRRDQAARLGIPYSTYMRHRRALGLVERPSTEGWLPWRMATEHHGTWQAKQLRTLAHAALGRGTKYEGRRVAALRWARNLLEKGLDVVYDREEGFSYVPANTDDWYLKRIYDAASRHVADVPQLDIHSDQD